MSYTPINTNERIKIKTLHSLRHSVKEIGERLKRHCNGIELGKGKAQTNYETKREHSKPKGKFTKELGGIIKERKADCHLVFGTNSQHCNQRKPVLQNNLSLDI